MKANFHKILNGLCLIILVASWQGCSVLGYGLGARIDSQKGLASDTLTSTQLEAIEIGTLIEVYNLNGNKVKGRFQGVEKYPFDYRRSFILVETNNKNVDGSFNTKVAIKFIDKVEVLKQKKVARFMGLAIGSIIDIAFIVDIFSDWDFVGFSIIKGGTIY